MFRPAPCPENRNRYTEGQVLTGSSFSEPMLVETVRENGSDVLVLGLVGRRSERFRRVTLTADEIADLTVVDGALSYCGDGRRLRLALQAYSLGIAYELNPYSGLSISGGSAAPPSSRPSTITCSSFRGCVSCSRTTLVRGRRSWLGCSSAN